MEQELANQLHLFNLSRAEEIEVLIDETEAREGAKFCENSLVGMIFRDTPMHFPSFRRALSEIWECETLQVYLIKPFIFHFIFPVAEDRDRILRYSPWCFDKHLLSIHKWVPGLRVEDELFKMVMFWVRVINIPLELTSEVVAQKIAATFNSYEKVEIRDQGISGGRYLRLRVGVDVTEPFRRGISLGHAGRSFWVDFRYERLPDLCYGCGRAGHGQKNCPWKEQADATTIQGIIQYGKWLNAVGGAGRIRRENQKSPSTSEHSNPDSLTTSIPENLKSQTIGDEFRHRATTSRRYVCTEQIDRGYGRQEIDLSHSEPHTTEASRDCSDQGVLVSANVINTLCTEIENRENVNIRPNHILMGTGANHKSLGPFTHPSIITKALDLVPLKSPDETYNEPKNTQFPSPTFQYTQLNPIQSIDPTISSNIQDVGGNVEGELSPGSVTTQAKGTTPSSWKRKARAISIQEPRVELEVKETKKWPLTQKSEVIQNKKQRQGMHADGAMESYACSEKVEEASLKWPQPP